MPRISPILVLGVVACLLIAAPCETVKPLTNEYYQSTTTLRVNADIHVNNATLQRRTPPDWKFEDQFEFYGFWLLNEEYIVSNALTGVMDLLETTMKVLSSTSGEGLPYGEEDPSYQRYFRKGDLHQVGAIFQRVLGILGAPGTSAIRQCIEASKLLLIYGDGPNSNRNCADETRGVFAYYNAFEDSNKTPRSYLAFCKRFFDSYKAHKPMSWDPSIPYVDSAKMGTSIDIADPSRLPEAESGASIVLHELLHWSDITKPVVPNQIEDLILVRPDTGEERTAYRSFYGAKVKDPAWKAKQPPTENADTYVYMVLEMFYRYRYGKQPWQDSPDLHGQPTSPNIPPAAP